jgi:hypothetical protein
VCGNWCVHGLIKSGGLTKILYRKDRRSDWEVKPAAYCWGEVIRYLRSIWTMALAVPRYTRPSEMYSSMR